jgi:hypothetical protein
MQPGDRWHVGRSVMATRGRDLDGIERHHPDLVGEHLDTVKVVADGFDHHVEQHTVVVDLDARSRERAVHTSNPVEASEGVERLVEARGGSWPPSMCSDVCMVSLFEALVRTFDP